MLKNLRLIRLGLGHRPALAGILALTATSAALAALQPWPLKILVDYGLGDEPVPAAIVALLHPFGADATPAALVVTAAALAIVLFVSSSAVEVALSWVVGATSQGMTYELAARLLRKLEGLSLGFHRRTPVGESLSRLTGDTWSAYTMTDGVLLGPWQHGFLLLAVGVSAWRLDPQLTLLSLSVAPFLGAVALFMGPRLQRRARLGREAQSRLIRFAHQTLGAIPLVQTFGREDRNLQQFEVLAAQAVSVSQRDAFVRSAFGVVVGLSATVGTAILLYLGGLRVLSGAISIGSLLVLLAYLRSMLKAWEGLLGIYGRLQSAAASAQRVLEVLDEEPEVRDSPGARPLAVGGEGQRGHVRLEGVEFGYEPGRAVLHGIDLEARPGERVALVGPTGAGKTTLVSLVPRFFDPWQGCVRLDGQDVRAVQLASLRRRVALVLQEPLLLPLSVAENIAYGRPEASRGEIERAAVAAHADGFIRALPEGYDTVLAERGATLSGGEKQRLSIARALLKDAPVLILDEPTSALDAETERLVLAALERLMEGRTTLVIAHRLSTIRGADRIVVLRDGRVVESGRHHELLRAGGAYAGLHRAASRGGDGTASAPAASTGSGTAR